MVEEEFVDIYPLSEEHILDYLPDIDCGDCGFSSCVAFAEALIEKRKGAMQCAELPSPLAAMLEGVLKVEFPPMTYDVMMEAVPPGIVFVGDPTPDSPVLATGNFKDTVAILREILETCEVHAYLLASDTKGYTIDNAVVEQRFTPFEVLKVITETGIGSQVRHHHLIIPGLAGRLAPQIKQVTGWNVVVGPVSGFEIPLFLVSDGSPFA